MRSIFNIIRIKRWIEDSGVANGLTSPSRAPLGSLGQLKVLSSVRWTISCKYQLCFLVLNLCSYYSTANWCSSSSWDWMPHRCCWQAWTSTRCSVTLRLRLARSLTPAKMLNSKTMTGKYFFDNFISMCKSFSVHASLIYDTRSLSALSAGALLGRTSLLSACMLVSSSVGGAFVHTKECFM